MDRVDELNMRINERNSTNTLLEPVYDPRPSGTRGGMMPIISTKREAEESFFGYNDYNPNTMYSNATKKLPFKGFADRINDESELRNQIFALQRSEKGTYVPQSHGDLYMVNIPHTQLSQEDSKHLYEGLFEEQNFNKFDPGAKFDTKLVFNNNTNQAVKNTK
tara:strand:- start:678 stop:1166 length:489 start_codon:yes stop_codon:yes gene_type:complete